MEQVATLIGQTGWPIASCILLAYLFVIIYKRQDETIRAQTEAINAIKTAIEAINVRLERLEDKAE